MQKNACSRLFHLRKFGGWVVFHAPPSLSDSRAISQENADEIFKYIVFVTVVECIDLEFNRQEGV